MRDPSAELQRIAQQLQPLIWSAPTPPGQFWVATQAAGILVTRCERWEAIVQRWRELPAQPPEREHVVVALRTDTGEVHVALFPVGKVRPLVLRRVDLPPPRGLVARLWSCLRGWT